jgi:hypothetical protein
MLNRIRRGYTSSSYPILAARRYIYNHITVLLIDIRCQSYRPCSIFEPDDGVVLFRIITGDFIELRTSKPRPDQPITLGIKPPRDTHGIDLDERIFDDLDGLVQVFLFDDEWRSESDATERA